MMNRIYTMYTKEKYTYISSLFKGINFLIKNNKNNSSYHIASIMLLIFRDLYFEEDMRISINPTTHYGDIWVSLAFSLPHKSSEYGGVTILVDTKRADYKLSNKDLEKLTDCMYMMSAGWGILTNGYKIYCYKLDDISLKYDLEGDAALIIDTGNIETANITNLINFARSAFDDIDYIKSTSNLGYFIQDKLLAEKKLEQNPPYNKLFFFNRITSLLGERDSVIILRKDDNKELLDKVLLKDYSQGWYKGIDIISIQAFMRLKENDRQAFMSFQERLIKMVNQIEMIRCKNKLDTDIMQRLYLDELSKVWGYNFKTQLERNAGVKIIDKDSIPFVLVIHSNDLSGNEALVPFKETCNNKKLIVETDMWNYYIRFGDKEIDGFGFCMESVVFADLYNLFLLSAEKYNDGITDYIYEIFPDELNRINKHIVELNKNIETKVNNITQQIYELTIKRSKH